MRRREQHDAGVEDARRAEGRLATRRRRGCRGAHRARASCATLACARPRPRRRPTCTARRRRGRGQTVTLGYRRRGRATRSKRWRNHCSIGSFRKCEFPACRCSRAAPPSGSSRRTTGGPTSRRRGARHRTASRTCGGRGGGGAIENCAPENLRAAELRSRRIARRGALPSARVIAKCERLPNDSVTTARRSRARAAEAGEAAAAGSARRRPAPAAPLLAFRLVWVVAGRRRAAARVALRRRALRPPLLARARSLGRRLLLLGRLLRLLLRLPSAS